jgi:tetratricopeptide (TPR) repeat protein
MSKLDTKARSEKSASTRTRWLAFTLSGIVAAGVAYWFRSDRPPNLKEPFVLPQTDLGSLPKGLSDRVRTLQIEILDGRDLIQNLTRLGRLAHASGLPEIATVCWAQLAAIEPANPHWPYYLADLARTRRDEVAELAALQKARALDARYAPTPLHLANLYFRRSELTAAKEAYQTRLQLEPKDPHARLGLARIAQREGHPAQRLALLYEMVELTPDFPSAHNLLAAELSAQGDVEGARKHRWLGHNAGRWTNPPDPWLEALDDDCYDPNRLYMLTTRDYQLNRTERATKWMQRAAELRPNDFAHFEFVGDLYTKLGEYGKAIEAMNRALALNDNRSPTITVFSNLAEAYRQTEKPALALKIAESGLNYHPDAVELHNSIGVSLNAMGDKADAMTAFRRSIKLQPYNPDANFNLGYMLLEQGEEASGIEAIRRSLTQQPTFSKALTFLGQYELTAGDMDEAKRLLERQYDEFWGMPEARRHWAEWHFKAGTLISATNEEEAESLYRAGLKIDDSLSDLNLGLGALFVSQNRIPEAFIALQKVQALAPDDPRGFLYLGEAHLANGEHAAARQQLQVGLELAQASGQTATAARCRELLRSL